MKLKHILVKYEYEAQDILRLLQQGRDFSELATKFSICSSAKVGGDLGDLTGKRLDQDFETEAGKLSVGQMSGIVRTRFGYHLILRSSD
jgi:peptidyl-prolyl cis-trans isomerase C